MSGAAPGGDPLALAERVRRACVQAALEAYELSGIQGLCAEGRWEAAVGAMRSLDLEPVLHARPPERRHGGPPRG